MEQADEKTVLTDVAAAWGWAGVSPFAVLAENAFGGLVIEDEQGRRWRISPDMLSCEVIAEDKANWLQLTRDQEFVEDFLMSGLAESARRAHGRHTGDERFAFVMPPPLGGSYAAENLRKTPLVEIIHLAGDIARQIRDLPDGAKIRLKITD